MKFKWPLTNLILIAILLFLVVNHVKHLPKKSSKLWQKDLEFHDFISQVKPYTNTLYYNDKKVDFEEFFRLHNLFSPYKNLVNAHRQISSVKIDYYLIKHFHNIKPKRKFPGDTILVKKQKEYDIYLIKTLE